MYRQPHVPLDTSATCHLNRVSLCAGLVRYVTASVHGVTTDRRGERNRYRAPGSVHTISKQIPSANEIDYIDYLFKVFMWTGKEFYITSVRSSAAFKQICNRKRAFSIQMPILLHNSLLKIDNKQCYCGRRVIHQPADLSTLCIFINA